MGDVGTRWNIRTFSHKLVIRPDQPFRGLGFSTFKIGCDSLKIRITKNQFDRIADALKEIIVSEIDSIKENIDVNEDGYVDIGEFKLVV